jgi:tetratricopeptide (TPR) repeat protein
MIMLDKERASIWIKVGAIVVASAFIITLMPAVTGGDLGGFFDSIFKGSTGASEETEAQAQILKLKETVEANPKDVKSLVALGNLYYDSGKYQSAITYYQKSIEINPKDYDVLTDMGASYNALNQPDKALELFNQVTAEKPDHAMAWFNLGVVYRGKDDKANMKFAWDRFLALQPTGELADQVREELKNQQ